VLCAQAGGQDCLELPIRVTNLRHAQRVPRPPDRARFEHQVAVLSAGRPVYWISAETRADPAEPRLRLATLLNGTIASQQALARYQSHGAWLEWTAQSPHPRGSAR
jgi:hypothetical protein